jgi:hypothetical protein
MVSSSDPALYAGASINYRYVDAAYHGIKCGGANPKPGIYTDAAHACWEWASLERIRQSIAASKHFNDPSISTSNADIIIVLLHWIRAGYSPTNAALATGGHDGRFIGAIAPSQGRRP